MAYLKRNVGWAGFGALLAVLALIYKLYPNFWHHDYFNTIKPVIVFILLSIFINLALSNRTKNKLRKKIGTVKLSLQKQKFWLKSNSIEILLIVVMILGMVLPEYLISTNLWISIGKILFALAILFTAIMLLRRRNESVSVTIVDPDLNHYEMKVPATATDEHILEVIMTVMELPSEMRSGKPIHYQVDSSHARQLLRNNGKIQIVMENEINSD